jgi:hypothetical protein
MKKEIKSVLKKLADEADEFPECFKKPFVYGEWIAATDRYSLIRVKSQGNNSGYSPLIKQIDVDHCFPSKTCNCLVDIEQLQEKLKSKNYTDWGDLLTVCDECGGVGRVRGTYTDRLGNDYEITGVCPICGGDSLAERRGVVKIADAIVKPKYLLLLCELAKATGGRVLLLNRGDAERQRLYFQIGEDIEMIIMQVHPSVARQEELLFELKID